VAAHIFRVVFYQLAGAITASISGGEIIRLGRLIWRTAWERKRILFAAAALTSSRTLASIELDPFWQYPRDLRQSSTSKPLGIPQLYAVGVPIACEDVGVERGAAPGDRRTRADRLD